MAHNSQLCKEICLLAKNLSRALIKPIRSAIMTESIYIKKLDWHRVEQPARLGESLLSGDKSAA